MPTQPASSIRTILDEHDFDETRIEAVGFLFHGNIPEPGRKGGPRGQNTLHFARCPRLDKAEPEESKIWFRTISTAKAHLDEKVGLGRWKWCKYCQVDVTQRLLDEQ